MTASPSPNAGPRGRLFYREDAWSAHCREDGVKAFGDRRGCAEFAGPILGRQKQKWAFSSGGIIGGLWASLVGIR